LVLAAAMCASAQAALSPTNAPDIRRDSTVDAIQRVMPAVLNIRTETVVERSDPFDRLLQEFWGPYYRKRPQAETTYSLGSGVMVDEEGWLITNFHVINRATRVIVRTADGREFEADRIVGTSFADVALVRLRNPKNEKFPVIKFAADDDLLLGETVIALGNPFGLGGSVSRGILSSKSRRPPLENEPLEIEDWLQTDAAINPGNSGGPLVNLRGELIGISVAVFREGQGIGFAIPIRRVSAALSEMYSPEILESYWFGARVKPGAMPLTVATVQSNSPAARAGFRVNDRILHVNGIPPRGFLDFVRQVVDAGLRRTTTVTVQRGNERRNLSLRLVEEKNFFNPELIRERTGATVEEITAAQAQALGLENRGVVITQVEPRSPAARAGFQENMIITGVDGQTAWYENQKAPAYVPVARVLHAKPRGSTAQFELVVPRRSGRFVQLQPAKVNVTLR
jgi:serine protease Do